MIRPFTVCLAFTAVLFCGSRIFAQAPAVIWQKEIAALNSSNINIGPYTATDQNGNTFLADTFNVPVLTVGNQTLTNLSPGLKSAAALDTFVAKFDSAGNFLWVRQIGGNGDDYVRATVVDSSRDLLVAVTSSSTNVFSGTNVLATNPMAGAGAQSVVVAKFDPQGNLVWAREILGSAFASGTSLAADGSGNIFLAGGYASSNLFFGTNSLNNSNSTWAPDFLAKYDATGNLLWVKQVNINEAAHPVVTADADGNSYLFETFSGVADFGTAQVTNLSLQTISMAKFDTNGNVLWAREAGRSGATNGSRIYPMRASVDGHGGCLLTGGYRSGSAVLQGATLPLIGQFGNAFVAKYDGSGNLAWANPIAGITEEDPSGVASDAAGNCYATGATYSPILVFGCAILTNTNSFAGAGYAAKYDAGGKALWARLLPFPGDDAVDSHGNLYVSGTTQTASSNVPFFSYFAAKISGPVPAIQPAAEQVATSWPSNAAGMNFGNTNDLARNTWSTATNAAPGVVAGQVAITNVLADPAIFFRLRGF